MSAKAPLRCRIARIEMPMWWLAYPRVRLTSKLLTVLFLRIRMPAYEIHAESIVMSATLFIRLDAPHAEGKKRMSEPKRDSLRKLFGLNLYPQRIESHTHLCLEYLLSSSAIHHRRHTKMQSSSDAIGTLNRDRSELHEHFSSKEKVDPLACLDNRS